MHNFVGLFRREKRGVGGGWVGVEVIPLDCFEGPKVSLLMSKTWRK